MGSVADRKALTPEIHLRDSRGDFTVEFIAEQLVDQSDIEIHLFAQLFARHVTGVSEYGW